MLGGIPRQVTLLCAPPWHLALDPTVALSSLRFVIYSTSSILAFFFFKHLYNVLGIMLTLALLLKCVFISLDYRPI